MGLPTIAVPQYTLEIPSSGKEVKFRPFLVKEEKILLLAMESEKTEEILLATKTIINNCVFDDLDVDNMPTFDMEYIFLQLRGKAKGEVIELQYKCPKCEGEIPLNINIDDIKIHKQDNHTSDVKLTEDLGVIMKYPNMKLQMDIAHTSEESSDIEQLFNTIVKCVDYIYDKENTYPSKDHTDKEMTDFLESLTDTQFQKLAEFFSSAPVLKHEIELKCKNKKDKKTCNYKESKVLEGLNSFFT
jgi:tetrahydromethanopterin S-methyltransferase subunit B